MRTPLRLFVMFLLCAIVLAGCQLPSRATLAPTSTATVTLAPTVTNTLPPPPSDTAAPPAPIEPTPTPTILYTVAVTFSPTPPPPPGVLVRIRNMTGDEVNLYRRGKSGEWHALGWLVHGYYGEYRFPALGKWEIRYCERDIEGNSYNCVNKIINVKRDAQEFVVP